MDKYQILEGTPYSRYAIPLEYLPSRDMAPRWGYSQPRIPSLDSWFRSNVPVYKERLSAMRAAAPSLADVPHQFSEANLPKPAWWGVPYSPFDSIALYWMMQNHKPKTYLEIGSGITTCFAHRAIQDGNLGTKIISIDPEPRTKIDAICNDVVRDGLETVDLSIFDQLEANDILFFDGSHRVFMNSDVTVFMIDVLPRLKPGVIIHIHDIVLPWDYSAGFKNWYWSEQYIVAVYMMGNKSRIDPILPTHFLCRDEAFKADLSTPFLDFGDANWLGGGAMWFTHTS